MAFQNEDDQITHNKIDNWELQFLVNSSSLSFSFNPFTILRGGKISFELLEIIRTELVEEFT